MRAKVVLLLLYLLSNCSEHVFAQPVSKVAIGINLAGEHDYDYSSEFYKYQVGLSAGFNLLLPIWKRCSFGTGLQFSDRTFAGSLDFSGAQFADISWEPLGIYRAELTTHEYFIDVPFKFYHNFGTGRLKGVAAAGITTGALLRRETTYDALLNNGELAKFTTHDQTGNWLFISPTASAGGQYEITGDIFLRTELTFMLLMRATGYPRLINRGAPVAGLNISLFRKF